MKNLFLGLLLISCAPTFAGPEETVDAVVREALEIVAGGNGSESTRRMCSLMRRSVDSGAVAGDILGRVFASLERDQDGIQRFVRFIPSIVVDQFQDTIAERASGSYRIRGTTPKGSTRVGVLVEFGRHDVVFTLKKNNLKIVDLTWNNISLVRNKASDYQDLLNQFYNRNPESSLPVTDLTRWLESQGITKCL